jgi:predicted transcriptional regulator
MGRLPSSPAVDGTLLSEVMTRDVVCVAPDMDVATVTGLLLERRISGAPVTDAEGAPIGILSKTDLLQELHDGHDREQRTARDIMQPISFSLPQNETLSRAAALMAFEGIHRILVLAPDGKVAGLVSSLDILRWLARRDGYVLGG